MNKIRLKPTKGNWVRGIEDNLKVIFLFLSENKCCDPSLEPSRQDSYNDGSQPVLLKTEKDLSHRKGPKRIFGHRKGLLIAIFIL